jgi:dCTP deaminase
VVTCLLSMIFNPYQEICRGYLDAEIDKIGLLNTKEIPDYLKQLCNDLIEHLEIDFAKIKDETDLRAFRANLTVVEDYNDLLSNLSSHSDNNWIIPLIKDCYRKSQISLVNRHIVVVNDSSSFGFAVISDFIQFAIKLYPPLASKKYARFDIFIVPYEIKFDISSVSIIAHEIGHIKLNDNFITVVDGIITTEFENYAQAESLGDLVKLSTIYSRREAISSYIQEYFCDEFGRFLLGPAFDFAICKLFCFSRIEDQNKGLSHPPTKLRIIKALADLREYSKNEYQFSSHIHTLLDYFKDIFGHSYTEDSEDKICQKISDILLGHFKINIINSFYSTNQYWKRVRTELDAFRPPFEYIDNDRRELNTPSEIIIASTIYYYGKVYKEANEYYSQSQDSEPSKFKKIREKIIEHVQYAINLFDFLKHSEMKIAEIKFEFSSLKNTLWDLRSKTIKTKPSPFIITPNIDPKNQYSSSSVDLRLGQTFLVNKLSKYTHIDPLGKSVISSNGTSLKVPIEEYYDKYVMPMGKQFTLHPHQFVLAQTLEYICIPADSYALVLGRSSWGRLGLNIATATAVGAGFRGCITLELRNLGETPLPLNVGLRICQISLIPITAIDSYQLYFTSTSKYIGPTSAEIPKIREDADWGLLEKFQG